MFVKHAIHSEITVALSVGEDEMMTFRGLKLLFIAGLIIALAALRLRRVTILPKKKVNPSKRN